jgi:hypothetical protein
MYDVPFFVHVVAFGQHVELSNHLILRSTVSCHVSFLLTVVTSDCLAKLFLILSETVSFVDVVELHSVRVVPVSTSRGCDPPWIPPGLVPRLWLTTVVSWL